MSLQLQHWLFVVVLLALYNVEPVATIHCKCVDDKCLADGSCQQGYACKSNYFGAFCEYYDALNHSLIPVSELQDQDLSTCSVLSSDLKVSYSTMKVYIVRLIIASQINSYKNYNFTFRDGTEEKSCEGHILIFENNVVEYYCHIMISSQEMIIENIAGNNICHVYVTEGRNMIENASITTKWKERDVTFYDKKGIIDGNREHVQGSCFLTTSITGPKSTEMIEFGLIAPSFVNYIEIFGNRALGDDAQIVGANILLIDIGRRFRVDYAPKQIHTKTYNYVPEAQVRLIRILKNIKFGVCEIEAYGDCANGTYGHDCKSICKPRCNEAKCTSKGICVSCIPGLVGQRCCKEFCAADKDCGHWGSCINGCVKKKYGVDCEHDCNVNCDGDGSCDINGTCIFGCKDGFFARDCSFPCSPNCGGRGDCHVNGSCVSACKPGYFGHDCVKYPIGCNCDSFKCNANGSCESGHKCMEKTFGYYCEYTDIDKRFNILELDDDNKQSCSPINGDLEISYNQTRIYMFRLIVEDSSQFKDISVAFRGLPYRDANYEEECQGHLLLLENKVIEYYCERLLFSKQLVIRGIGGHGVCHVYLTEGRNMLLRSKVWTNSYSRFASYYDLTGLINGVRQNVKGSCYLTHPFTQTKYVVIYLKANAFFNLAYLFGLSDRNVSIRMHAVLAVIDTKGKTVQTFNLYEPTLQLYYQHTDIAVSRLTTNITHPFGSCEMELYGDCAIGTYGYDCNLNCSSRCKNSRCTSKGFCIGCKEGLTGLRCCKPFCVPDKDCDRVGNCIHGCVKRKYGIDCEQDCSPYCAGEGECDIDGTCIDGCETGFFGPQCLNLALSSQMSGEDTMTCHCSGEKCKYPLDHCEHFEDCITGWFGYSCAYKDLAATASLSDTSLNDNDIETCQPFDTRLANVVFGEPVMFSFVVLTFKEDADVHKFAVLTRTLTLTDLYREDRIRFKIIKQHVYQVDILARMLVDEVTVSWTGYGALCSLLVSGDRDLALELAPILTENPALNDVITTLTDGILGGQNCLNTKQTNALYIPLQSSVYLSRVIIFPDISNKESAVFTVKFILDGVPVISQHLTITGNRFAIAEMEFNKKYNGLELELTTEKNGTVKICEIQIYGDCHPPSYGFSCEQTCPSYCRDQLCDFEGLCLHESFRDTRKSRSYAETVHVTSCTIVIILLAVTLSVI